MRDGLIATLLCVGGLFTLMYLAGMAAGVIPMPPSLQQFLTSTTNGGVIATIIYIVLGFALLGMVIENAKLAGGYFSGLIRQRSRLSRGR